MTETELYETTGPQGPTTTRRNALKMLAAGGTAATVGSGAAGDEFAPVGDAEAIAPAILYAGVVGGSIALGWALREFEVIGSDTVSDGLSASALREHIDSTSRNWQSQNQSTFVDNKNIIESGVKDAAYADGKIAAIQAINNEQTQSQVEAAALNEVDSREETVITNFLKSWNESAQQAMNLGIAADQHADVAPSYLKPFGTNLNSIGSATWDPANFSTDYAANGDDVTTYTFNNGNTFEIQKVVCEATNMDHESGSFTGTSGFLMHPNKDTPHGNYGWFYVVSEGNGTVWMHEKEWHDILVALENAFQSARDGLILWVDNVYGQVQAGELDPANLLTNSELSKMTADDEEYNQAVADLMALNVSVNLEREAEVYFPGEDVTVYGSLAVTGDTTLNTGTIDPSADSHSYYLTYDVSQGEGIWSAYQEGIDGGVVTFNSEPHPDSEYAIDTTGGETAMVASSEFVDQGDGTWTTDVSDQLENSITNIDSVMFYAETSETDYQTILLEDQFEIVTFTDSEGNEYSSADHTSTTPHDDTNYITEEEWQERQDRYEELIDRYEESKSGGGGFNPDDFAWGPIPGVGVLGGAATLSVAFVAWAANQ